MACIIQHNLSASISGLVTDVQNSKDNAIWYKIQVEMNELWWNIERRYSDFEALHKKLVDAQIGIPRDSLFLPPKKLLGNKEPQFVEKRREQLQVYLNNLLQLLGKNPPEELASFLNLYEFEIIFMLRKLALEIFEKGDKTIERKTFFTLSPYQINAINLRKKIPIPPLESIDKRHDFGHIIDFINRVKYLEIVGSNIPLGKSTIIPNQYPVDLTSFKSLTHLSLKMINVRMVTEIGSVRRFIERISIQNSHLESTNELLLCDSLYKTFDEAGEDHVWPQVKSLDLSNNVVKEIQHDIGRLVPVLRHIDLSFNQLTNVFSLTSLPYLEHVNMAGNVISQLPELNLLFGNVKNLDLSQNQIRSLSSFSKLYSLTGLNVSCNLVSLVEEVSHLANLPCLEVLILTGNPVAATVDFRVRALAFFAARAADICLDNEKASLLEMDQIAILQAIDLAKKSTDS